MDQKTTRYLQGHDWIAMSGSFEALGLQHPAELGGYVFSAFYVKQISSTYQPLLAITTVHPLGILSHNFSKLLLSVLFSSVWTILQGFSPALLCNLKCYRMRFIISHYTSRKCRTINNKLYPEFTWYCSSLTSMLELPSTSRNRRLKPQWNYNKTDRQ